MKIEPHFKCLEGEHVFIPSFTKGNGRDLWVTEFVCQHCLGKVDTRSWQIQVKKLEDYEKQYSPAVLEISQESPILGTNETSVDAFNNLDMPPPKKKKR